MGRKKRRSVDIVSFERELTVWILSCSTWDCYSAGVGIFLISAAIFFKEVLKVIQVKKEEKPPHWLFMKSKLELRDF